MNGFKCEKRPIFKNVMEKIQSTQEKLDKKNHYLEQREDSPSVIYMFVAFVVEEEPDKRSYILEPIFCNLTINKKNLNM